jgi:undecaprenyl-diphosphatase
LGAFVALVVSRLIQNLSPHRPRPIHSEWLGLEHPFGVGDALQEWSSFPSDNTAVAFALAAGIWCGSRFLGWACLAWSAVVVGFPRIYAGFHYPSDVVSGAVLGMVATFACAPLAMNAGIKHALSSAEMKLRPLFYSFSFGFLFQLSTMFDDVRKLVRGLLKVAEQLF